MSDDSQARTILVAVDTSKNAKAVFEFYLRLIKRPTDKIVFYHVFESPHLPSFNIAKPQSIPSEEWLNILQKKAQEVNQMETDYTLECQSKSLACTFFSENQAHVGEAICAKAMEVKADMILLGTRGLGALKRTIMGSVSDFVLHHANIAVMVIPANSNE